MDSNKGLTLSLFGKVIILPFNGKSSDLLINIIYGHAATDDYTPFLSVLSALKFAELCNVEKIMAYNHDLVARAGVNLFPIDPFHP